ncbi:MAG TPA: hypothetical protein VIM11_27990 [Tepidisphaeraceae bacterium]|jgi:hypothetical protein
MDIVKKNILSIVCGVIALLAIAAIPTFIRAQQKALQTRVKEHADTYNSLLQLQKNPRHQPVVSATDPNAAAPDLPGFPGPKVIESGKAAIQKVQEQSLQLEKLATEMNKHTLLVPNSLPNGSDTFTFQRDYQKEMQHGIVDTLNSVTPPTQAEIDTQKAALRAEALAKAPLDQATGKILYEDAVQADIALRTAELPDQMRNNAAKRHKMYMAASSALSSPRDVASGANGMTALPAEEIWLAQLGLWVQQDVAKAIADINSQSKSVAASPVKELVLIDVPSGREIYATPASVGTAAAAPTGAVVTGNVANNAPTEALPQNFNVSPTGRVCNGVFDVVHFTVCINVNASEVNRIIQQLQRGRLLTVYWTDIQVVNSAEKQEEGYFYGPVPVVTLTLKCEELFMRSWTRPLMPPSIKQYLNVQEPAAQPTAMTN